MKTRWGGIGGALAAIGTLILLIVIGWLVYQAGYREGQDRQSGTTTDETATAPPTDRDNEKEGLVDYRSEEGVVIRLDRRLDNTEVTSPLTITGEVPGNWSFEGDFPVELRDADNTLLITQPATLQGEWMTTSYVPFKVTLTFANTSEAQSGQLILRKSNASGETANDDRVTIPVRFSSTTSE